jgi:hypothetical protein
MTRRRSKFAIHARRKGVGVKPQKKDKITKWEHKTACGVLEWLLRKDVRKE